MPTDRPRTLADLMVESGLAEDEGNALKNERGQRHQHSLQAAEWERGTRMVDGERPRRVWLPPCHSPRPSAGDVTSLPLPSHCVGSAGVVPSMLREPYYVRPAPWTRTSDCGWGVAVDLRSRVPSVKRSWNRRRRRILPRDGWLSHSCLSQSRKSLMEVRKERANA